MTRRLLLLCLLSTAHTAAQAPGQGIAQGLFRLKEMDFHLHSGMERPVDLDGWIDLAAADGRRVLLLLDHLELYRKSRAEYEAWRSKGGFQVRYPLAAAGHGALFADFDGLTGRRQDVVIFKGWEVSEDELDDRIEMAPMRMADAIGWHISPRNGKEPPNGQTLLSFS